MLLDLAGWRVELDCRPAGLAHAVAVRYAPFVVSGSGAHAARAAALATARAELTGPAAPATLAGAAGLAAADVDITTTPAGCRLAGPELAGFFDDAAGSAWLTLSGPTALSGIEYFLRVIYALLAYREGGLLVHSAGLLRGGKAYLLIGPSGVGKSTATQLAGPGPALSDDLVLIRPAGAGWRAHGTPFWNLAAVERSGQTAAAPLAAIYRLVQDLQVYREPLPVSAAAAELAASCPVVNADPARWPALLDRCAAISRRVPIARLHFRKDPQFLELL